MEFRLLGLLLLATAAGILWYCKPAEDGHTRYPTKLKKYVDNVGAVVVTVLIGVALPRIALGASGQIAIFNDTP